MIFITLNIIKFTDICKYILNITIVASDIKKLRQAAVYKNINI